MTKELLMTPKAISDRKRLEAKKNGTWQSRKLSQSKDNVRRREVYHQKKRRALTISESTAAPKPVTVTMDFPDLDKLTRKELKRLVLESRRGIPAPTYDLQNEKEAVFWPDEPTPGKMYAIRWRSVIEMRENLFRLSHELKTANDGVATLEATVRERDSTIAQLKSEIQTARRQRDEANAHSKILGDNLEIANWLIKANNDRGVEIDRMIGNLNIGMGELNRRAIRWKFAFLSVLFVVALPSIATASAAVYLLTHR